MTDEEGKERAVALIKEGGHFGEVSLLTEYPRTATVVSKNYCTLAVLSKDYFKSLIVKYPETEGLL